MYSYKQLFVDSGSISVSSPTRAIDFLKAGPVDTSTRVWLAFPLSSSVLRPLVPDSPARLYPSSSAWREFSLCKRT